MKMNTSKGSYADLERFAHVCSHDLKEPLRIVANCIQLLCAHNADRFDDTSMAYVKHILKRLNRMDAMIKNILNYSKVSSIRDVCCDVDLNEVVNTIKNDFMFLLEDVDGTIHIDHLPILSANPTQMYQLFMNLISNAIKYRSQEPLLIHISAVDNETMWKLSIKDNGVGIEEEFQEIVFDMFKRLKSTSLHEGSGVGLSICKKIVEAHGGNIIVQANPDGGCEFTLWLPK